MKAVRRGDEVALARLYDESSTLLYSLAVRMLSDRADAEEIVLDVYSQVWRSAATWDSGRAGVAGWLVMLCRSRCLDRLRARASRIRAEVPLSSSQIGGVTAFFSADSELVGRAMAVLPADQRELLEMAYFDGFTHSELAERLGLPLGTVKTRIRAGIMRLRDLLKEYVS